MLEVRAKKYHKNGVFRMFISLWLVYILWASQVELVVQNPPATAGDVRTYVFELMFNP